MGQDMYVWAASSRMTEDDREITGIYEAEWEFRHPCR